MGINEEPNARSWHGVRANVDPKAGKCCGEDSPFLKFSSVCHSSKLNLDCDGGLILVTVPPVSFTYILPPPPHLPHTVAGDGAQVRLATVAGKDTSRRRFPCSPVSCTSSGSVSPSADEPITFTKLTSQTFTEDGGWGKKK